MEKTTLEERKEYIKELRRTLHESMECLKKTQRIGSIIVACLAFSLFVFCFILGIIYYNQGRIIIGTIFGVLMCVNYATTCMHIKFYKESK